MEFLSEIKKNTLKNIPLIIFSTTQVAEMKRPTAGLGASGYITKPNDYHALKEVLLLALMGNK